MGRQTGFGDHLASGVLRWDLVHPFPCQDLTDRRVGDDVIADLSSYLVSEISPDAVEEDGTLVARLLADLGTRGLLEMRAGKAAGGLGLTEMNTFRVIEATASWTCAGAFSLAVQNGIGAGAHLPVLPDGPLRDEVSRRMAARQISGSADTEPAGAANRYPQTLAVPVDDGAAYLLNGDKAFISNSPIAGLLCVSATVDAPAGRQVQIFFVDTAAAGLTVESRQDFMGLRGHANATVRLRDVRVPRDMMLNVAQEEWRMSDQLRAINAFGRMLIIAAPSVAVAKLCLHWQREFARRRTVDGRALGSNEKIQRIISDSLADVLAMESVVEWCLLAGATDLALERTAVKNITSVTCWRVLERTMSLLAAEGYERAGSKARRGAQPLPLERFYRDARMLRIGGGVDFQVDNWGAQAVFERCFYQPLPALAAAIPPPAGQGNREHLLFVADQAARFAATGAALASRHPEPEQLFERQNLMINLHRIVSELLTMALTVARSAGQSELQPLADAYCTAARHRVLRYWQRADDAQGPPGPDHEGISAAWLAGTGFGMLLDGVITQAPPA